VAIIKDKPNILIVDDKPANILALEGLLEGHDRTILKAYSGSEALKIAARNELALILLDVQMPDMDGFEVAELLRLSEKSMHVPIIFITAISTDSKNEYKGYEKGAVDYLFKPFEPYVLLNKVKVFLDLYNQKKMIELQSKELNQKVLELQKANLKIENANRELEKMALIDGLTGIPNRHHMENLLTKEWRRSQREASHLSIMMIDIDYFKNFNDFYGHLVGDECLKRIAQTLEKTMRRPYDYVARYGGEEFLAMLPSTDQEGCYFMAERFLNVIQELKIPHEKSSIASHVTISIGAAIIVPNFDSSITQLIEKADQALYEAKNNGRNQYKIINLLTEDQVKEKNSCLEDDKAIPINPHEINSILNNKTILLVDDDMVCLYALSSILSEKGVNVIKAENGRDAIEVLRNSDIIDLIFMDMMMPEMDGYVACKKIREQKEYQNLPIIALTSKALKGDRDKCINAGASDYLSKPLDMDRLFSMIQNWLK